jgi:PAS domain S-box-containing protein
MSSFNRLSPYYGTTSTSLIDSEAQSALRDRDRQLQLISENFPQGALYQYTVTADGRRLLTYLGRGFERIFGELPAEIPVDVAWLTQRIHPADEPGMAAVGDRSHRELAPFHHEVRIRTKEGDERWVSFRSQPRAMADGSVVWDGAIIDVTDQRRAEEAVRRQAAFLVALNQTTLELLQRRNVTELLQLLVDRAAALLNSTHAELSLLEGDGLVVRAFSSGREFLAGDRITRKTPALSWRALDTRGPVVTDRYAEHPDSRAVYLTRGVHAAAVFPIVRDGECVGVLGVAREQAGNPYTNEDVQEGQSLAQMAALVLHNANIHEDAVREVEARTAVSRENEECFRVVFDKSPFVLGLVSIPDGKIVALNAAALAAYGYTREEAIGKTTQDLGLWVDPLLRKQYLALLTRTGSVSGFEAQMRRKNGEIITVMHTGSLITLGGHVFALSANEDISARKQSESARVQSLALMRATLESTADGILVVNTDGHIETFNRNFAEMWQLDQNGPLAAPVTGLAAPDDESPAPLSSAEEERVLRTILDQLIVPEDFLISVRDLYAGSEDEVLDVLRCKDGRIYERYSRPQLVGSVPVGRVWSFRDITDQRRAEAALREGEERFRVLAEVSPAGIFSSDPEGRCMFVNRRWCEIAGMSAEEAAGEGWKRALHPDDRARVDAGWGEAVRSRQSSAAEFRFVRPDGTVTWLVGQSRQHFHADGTLAGYVGTITDVTSLKRAEEERKRLEAQSRQSRKMESLGTLAGGIAHDFNNILTGIFGFVDLARLEMNDGHPAQAWLDRISASSMRARELVRQILTFSRKNEGERVPQRLHVVVGEALRLLRSTLPPMVEIVPRIATNAPPVLANATQIHQVVVNLCTNAWDAMPARGGRIDVALEACTLTAEQAAAHVDLYPGEWLRLTVTDDGSGMDALTLEHIFEPFFTTKEVGRGTGLGLAVVHGIVQSHDGAIVVRSELNRGSTFELYFPTVAAELDGPVVTPSPLPRGKGERILVVDDDAVSGFAVEKMLESINYQPIRFARPEEALEHFRSAPDQFDLVVSDLAMPGMNGAELIEHLVQIRPGMPVVVITGYIESERKQLLEKTAARAVLRKPVSRDELARAIAQHLGRAP